MHSRWASAAAIMVSHTALCQHLQGIGPFRPSNHCPPHRRPVATISLTHVSTTARQPLPRRQQRQLSRKLQKHASDCVLRCAAAVGKRQQLLTPSTALTCLSNMYVWHTHVYVDIGSCFCSCRTARAPAYQEG